MISVILAVSLGLVNEVSVEQASHFHALASASREELGLIERLRTFRIAVEKLPETWSASGIKSLPQGAVITKPGLLREIEGMELSAAERWNVIIENSALLDRPLDGQNVRANQMRKLLNDLPRVHQDVNQRLDMFNTQMKDGILNKLTSNLANKILRN
jgi:hypothetical protein